MLSSASLLRPIDSRLQCALLSRRVKAEHGNELSIQISWHRSQPPHFIPCLPRYALRGLATHSVPNRPLALVCMALRLPRRLELVVPRGLATWKGTGKIPSLLYIQSRSQRWLAKTRPTGANNAQGSGE